MVDVVIIKTFRVETHVGFPCVWEMYKPTLMPRGRSKPLRIPCKNTTRRKREKLVTMEMVFSYSHLTKNDIDEFPVRLRSLIIAWKVIERAFSWWSKIKLLKT